MADIKPDVIKKTQEMLGKHIKAPPLTGKLLTKPPFRYLHDIVTNMIKETGYMDGLFTAEEMKSENVKEKDAKIAYLQKLIAEVKSTTKAKLAVRPSKIIAGLEPTETNLLLQAIAEGANKKSNPQGAAPPAKKTNKAVTNASPREKKDDTGKKKTVVKPSGSTGSLNKKAELAKPPSKTTPRQPTNTKKATKTDKTNNKPNKAKESKSSTSLQRLKSTENSPKENDEAQINSTDGKEAEEKIEEKHREEKIEETLEEVPKTEEAPREFNEHRTEKMEVAVDMKEVSKNENMETKVVNVEYEITKPDVTESQDETKEEIKEFITNKARPPTAKHQLQQPPQPQAQPLERPKTSLRPPSVRPMSARPGAPKIRDKQDPSIPVEEVITMGQVQVIVEDLNAKETDEEETVVIKTVTEPVVQAQQQSSASMTNGYPEIPNEQGHLVSQILQQLDDDVEMSKPKEDNVGTMMMMKPGEMSKELDHLRTSIQTLTKSANPLGKLMNYLQEDVEAMYDELIMWKNINVEIRRDIIKHKQECENATKPLKNQLQELQENIQKQQDEIHAVRANIYNNKRTIEHLLSLSN